MSIRSALNNAQWRSRAAVGILLAVAGAVVVSQPELTTREALLRWLVYVIITGIVINIQASFAGIWLAYASIASAIGTTLTLGWMLEIQCRAGPIGDIGTFLSKFFISGVQVCGEDHLFLGSLFATIFIGTTAAIWLACYARPVVLMALQTWLKIPPQRARRIEKLLHATATAIGSVWLAIHAFVR